MSFGKDALFGAVLAWSVTTATFGQADHTAGPRDVEALRDQYVRALLPDGATERERLIRDARETASTLRADGTWPDVDYQDRRRSQWPVGQHLARALLVAKAARLSAAAGAPDDALAARSLTAVNWWLDHDLQNPNWWWNQIGVPQQLGETLLVLGPAAPRATVARGIAVQKRSVWTSWTGQNLVWGTGIQVVRGLLEGDPEVVAQAYARMYDEVRIAPPGKEGIQTDFSFHQHGAQFYSGGYGLAFGNDVGRFIAYTRGTRFEPPAEKMAAYAGFILDGQQWMIRGRTFDYSAVGREITRPGKAAFSQAWSDGPVSPAGAAYGLVATVSRLAEIDSPRRAEFAAFAARLRDEPAAPALSGHWHFWRSDYAVHHQPAYFASVRMFSDRLVNTEEVNDEGRKSHHLADGCMLLYRDGDEYRDIFPVWDWNKVPGTTVELADGNTKEALDVVLPRGNRASKGRTSFVGGASDGDIGIAAMDLERGSLTAKKAWFFFDGVVVCLGAGITCDSDRPVVTTIEQNLLASPPILAAGAPDAVAHDRVRYRAPGDQRVRHTAARQTGSWAEIGTGPAAEVARDVFSLWIEHGARPRDATYHYEVRPDTASTPEATVLANDGRVQAAQVGGDLGVVFRAPADLTTPAGLRVAVDQPCVLLVRQSPRDGAVTVTAANPRNAPMRLRVTINRRLAGEAAVPTGGGTEVRLDLPNDRRAGSSVTVKLRPVGTEN